MLDASPARGDGDNVGDVENNEPVKLFSGGGAGGDGAKPGARARLLRKGGRKLLQHKPPRNGPSGRRSDINNNGPAAAAQPGTEPQVAPHTVLTLHPLSPAARKGLLKSKGGKLERGASQPGGPASRHLPKHAASAPAPKPKQDPQRPPDRPPPAEQKKPLHASDNLRRADPREKVYAGAKFSEPPSPSVLPRPPSHWVGAHTPPPSGPELMTLQLKTLLKVPDAP